MNGLGAWWFPNPVRVWLTKKSAEFFDEAAWQRHDRGYNLAIVSRETCDRKFLQAMLRDASRSHRPARTAVIALFLWVCVRVGGSLSYGKKKRWTK